MGDIIRELLNLSIMTSFIIALAFILRFFVNKWERRYAYYMWIAVFVSLCIPRGLYGPYSLVPSKVTQYSILTVAEKPQPQLQEQKQENDQDNSQNTKPAVNPVPASEKATYVGDRELSYPKALSYIWFLGFLLVCGWNISSMIRLRLRTRTAWKSDEPGEEDVWICDKIAAPFILGVINPKIYIPTDIGIDERTYILAHERYHQKRFDHISKVLAFLLVSIFWFNPLIWLAYGYFVKDLEFSCDEAVVRTSADDIRKKYAESLLKYAAKQNRYILSPLTFAEPSMKSRILHVLKYKKKSVIGSFFMSILILIFAIGLIFKPEVEAGLMDSDSNVAETESEADSDSESMGSGQIVHILHTKVDVDNDGIEEVASVKKTGDNVYFVGIISEDGRYGELVEDSYKGYKPITARYDIIRDIPVIIVELKDNLDHTKLVCWAFGGEKFVKAGEIDQDSITANHLSFEWDYFSYFTSRDHYYREKISYTINNQFQLEKLSEKRNYEIPQEKIVYDFSSNIDSLVEYEDYYELKVSAYSPIPAISDNGEECYAMGDYIGDRKLRISKNLFYETVATDLSNANASENLELCAGDVISTIYIFNQDGLRELLEYYPTRSGFTVDYRGYIVELYDLLDN